MTMIVFCEHRRAEGSEAWACQVCGQLCNRTSSWESCLALEPTSFDRAARAVNKVWNHSRSCAQPNSASSHQQDR
jgi:hypothetical protein